MAPYSQSQFTKSLVSHKEQREKITSLGFLIFLVGVLYYCFAYLLRIYPNIMEPLLLSRFHTTSFGYSFLIVFYYIAYAPMQIPVGVLVDKLGPKRTLLAACLTSMTGVLIFSATDQFSFALFGRLLIGIGAAFAYVTALKLASMYLPKRYFATATGVVTSMGMIAAGVTEITLTHILQRHGYLSALRTPLYVGLTIFILILLFVRDSKSSQQRFTDTTPISYYQLWRYVKLIFSDRQMWLIGVAGCLLYLPASAFLDAWAIPYLMTNHQFTPIEAANGIFAMLLGWIIAGIAAGVLSDIIGKRQLLLLICSILATLVSCTLIFSSHLSHAAVFTLLVLFGISCGPHALCFTLSKENWNKKIAGTAVACTNFIVMMGGFIMQPLIGSLLVLGWDHQSTVDGVPVYSAIDFKHAMAVIPISLAIATIATYFIHETYKRHKDEAFELDQRIKQLADEES